jgi:septal ring factor EnvC (AmiA/AmiB activator)
MEVNAEVLQEGIQKTTWFSNIISISIATMAAVAVGFGFYFNTKSTLELHEKKIDSIEKEVELSNKLLTEIQVYKGVSSSEMQNLEKKVDKIDEKLDKLLLFQTR